MTVQEYVARARVAVNEISGYTQEQVDKLVYEGAKIIYKNAVPLAKLAVEETGLGFVEDKIGKNTDTPTVFYDYLKDKKSVGIIEEIPELGIMKVAHPVGVIAAITPCTNPTVTPLGNFMHAVKGKNALVISPHPRSLQTTTDTVNLIREALVKCGAPADLIQVLEEPSMAASAELMAACDLVVATGSSGLTKAAHESGTPAYGVGPGNPPAIVDRGYDLTEAAKMTVIAVGSDNGILCDGDNMLLYPEESETAMVDALKAEGVVVFEDGNYSYYEHDKLPNSCHGTGDIYASAFVGALTRGKTAFEAAKIAADYAVECIRYTGTLDNHWYGAAFEPVLGKLIEALQ